MTIIQIYIILKSVLKSGNKVFFSTVTFSDTTSTEDGTYENTKNTP